MSEEQFYLKPNVVTEPLFDRWYAWAHLISPATGAMNVANRHLKIMDSYLQAPQIHQMAVKNPKMLGGPFIDYEGTRSEEIKNLRDETIEKQAKSIKLSKAIKELDEMLKSKANGCSLEGLYELVPEELKGYVELVYDLNNNASYRLFEPLLYSSEYYRKDSQSIAFSITENDERPFCLSTPRLDDEGVLHHNIPFDHPGLDDLCKMKRTPGSIDTIAEKLEIKSEDRALFDTFFTAKEHPTYKNYDGDKARMRYFGHACILLETKDVSVLIDPIVNYYGYDSNVDHFSDIDLPDVIDYILITHNHQDHILLETLIPLRHKVKNIIVPRSSKGALQDPSLKLMLKSCGFNNVIEVDDMEEINFKDCTITGLPFTGEHGDLNIQAKSCYHVRMGESSFMFVADSKILEKRIYENIYKTIGDIDVLFLGMECEGAPYSWLYGPLFTKEVSREDDQTRRLSGCDYEKGMNLVDTFNPKEVYVYAMGAEPWLEFISSIKYAPDAYPIVQSDMLVKKCTERGLVSERLFGEKELMYTHQLEEELVSE
ncbi:MAG: L-ascorbate metabolism protein UlaG (beta-lactamase superfamily) [Crocinitomicaceae bacterium]|jgi:L-ascorbate metabolism protein UlaG (beta-lactamase superfamily)